jgi:hypothetical protein
MDFAAMPASSYIGFEWSTSSETGALSVNIGGHATSTGRVEHNL